VSSGEKRMTLSEQNRATLHEVSVATLTTCLFRRGYRNVWMENLVPVDPALPRMVGEAYTLRFIPAREDIDRPDTYSRNDNLHRRAIEECPPGQVLVVDTQRETRACTCGDLLVARLKARGAAGIVTDGGFRDTPDIAGLDFPAYHRRAIPPASFSRLHAVELNGPVGCAGVAVYPGDIVVGDHEGVVVIPAHIANEVAEEAGQMTRYDEFAAEKIREGRSIFGLYPSDEASRAEFAAWEPA
jgi:regulator of RNase E activity RraA